jgi:hypothetical protein
MCDNFINYDVSHFRNQDMIPIQLKTQLFTNQLK